MSSEPDPTRAVTRGSGRVVIVTGRSSKFFVGYPVLPVSFCVDTRYILDKHRVSQDRLTILTS